MYDIYFKRRMEKGIILMFVSQKQIIQSFCKRKSVQNFSALHGVTGCALIITFTNLFKVPFY